MDYLGLVISKDHVVMDPVKVQGVTDWLQPAKVKDVQSFIGFMNFSEIAPSMHSPISLKTGCGVQLNNGPLMH